ncbi:hypothetical protein FOZ60_005993 [Perkinsus olseni]|uniref:Uncharacterized protein n=1 Tax=Perkinsus olseni TaxID=32597 RepID=A0A7J6NPW8_PEROL|nr:hypothetical protein FOZ60_005993 [Perkinsus olseni]
MYEERDSSTSEAIAQPKDSPSTRSTSQFFDCPPEVELKSFKEAKVDRPVLAARKLRALFARWRLINVALADRIICPSAQYVSTSIGYVGLQNGVRSSKFSATHHEHGHDSLDTIPVKLLTKPRVKFLLVPEDTGARQFITTMLQPWIRFQYCAQFFSQLYFLAVFVT